MQKELEIMENIYPLSLKDVKIALKKILGWSIREWARRHEFPESVVYQVLSGAPPEKVGRLRRIEIITALEADLRAGECIHRNRKKGTRRLFLKNKE